VKAAQHIAGVLAAEGVTHVFEVVGGTIAHLIDTFHADEALTLVSVHHEQAAAFAADGFARATGVPGVAMATSGPGATNLLTGLASCYFDSVPAVFLTGQVRRDELTGDRGVRQQGFQETDVVAMASPVAKAAWRLDHADEIPVRVREAFAIARSDRPGPVLVDIPADLQSRPVGPPSRDRVVAARAPDPGEDEVCAALGALQRAERPLVLVGGGIRAGGARAALRRWADLTRVPVVHSLMAVDALPCDHPARVGMIGAYGNRWANLAIGRADALLVLGSRLDIRQTGADVAFFGARTIHHVDCDPAEVNNRVHGCRAVLGDVRAFLEQAAALAGRAPVRPAWTAEIAALRERWPDTAELAGVPGINPNRLMHELSRASAAAAVFVADVGQHQMWAAQSLAPAAHQRFVTSGGLGAMGYALPAALGASLSLGGAPVVVIAGDGGFQVNIQELQTVVETGAPLKMVVLDNGTHGMVRQFQASYFGRRFASSTWGYSAPDFARVAEAYGIAARTISRPDEVAGALAEAWRDPASAFLLCVKIDPEANAYPKIAFGRPITEMEPFARPVPLDREG
jgi:acetolactate synthase-1/2/3 large subunit